jgi:hypothetical protein
MRKSHGVIKGYHISCDRAQYQVLSVATTFLFTEAATATTFSFHNRNILWRISHHGLYFGRFRYGTFTFCADDPGHAEYRELRTLQGNASQNSRSASRPHENVARCSLREIHNTLTVSVLCHDLPLIITMQCGRNEIEKDCSSYQ